jgi:putative phosphoesterase
MATATSWASGSRPHVNRPARRPTQLTVGVISDTHGLLRPEALDALRGSDLILHAGDVGPADILARLRDLAPTVAVRGNVDTAVWATALPLTEVVQAGDLHLYMLHDRAALDLDPVAAGFAAVIFGHSHRPGAEVRDGVLYLNPGSAGPRRFTLPVTVARLTVAGAHLSHEIVELRVSP